MLKILAWHAKFLAPCLVYPYPRLPPGGSLGRLSLGTPKILSTGATLHFEPIRLHVENLECRALNLRHGAKNLVCHVDFFSTCKWGLNNPNLSLKQHSLKKKLPTPRFTDTQQPRSDSPITTKKKALTGSTANYDPEAIQGQPTNVFCKTSARRSKYCLEFSIT